MLFWPFIILKLSLICRKFLKNGYEAVYEEKKFLIAEV